MEIVFVLLPFALVLACLAVVAFIWSVRSGQLDDLDTPPNRILIDEIDEVEKNDQVCGAKD